MLFIKTIHQKVYKERSTKGCLSNYRLLKLLDTEDLTNLEEIAVEKYTLPQFA